MNIHSIYSIEYHTSIKNKTQATYQLTKECSIVKVKKYTSQRSYIKIPQLVCMYVCGCAHVHLNVLYMSMEKGIEEYKRYDHC